MQSRTKFQSRVAMAISMNALMLAGGPSVHCIARNGELSIEPIVS
jgi:hypothetical protein